MDTLTSLAVIAFAALIHASFQLSVSMLTLLSGHTIGSRARHAALMRLSSSFSIGVGVMTLLLLSASSFAFLQFFPETTPVLAWAIVSGMLLGLGVAVWAFYYRKGAGTSLWLPRGLARYLSARSKTTNMSGEAFGLGLSSVLAELLFIITPIVVASLVIIRLPNHLQIAGLITYTGISMLSLLLVTAMVGSGHRLSRIQRWREANKHFLQFAGGSGLVILAFYLYVDQIVSSNVVALGGSLH